jgi:hypothetical protein
MKILAYWISGLTPMKAALSAAVETENLSSRFDVRRAQLTPSAYRNMEGFHGTFSENPVEQNLGVRFWKIQTLQGTHILSPADTARNTHTLSSRHCKEHILSPADTARNTHSLSSRHCKEHTLSLQQTLQGTHSLQQTLQGTHSLSSRPCKEHSLSPADTARNTHSLSSRHSHTGLLCQLF